MGHRSATGLGSPLITRLSEDAITAVDVPAKLAARVRTLSTGHGRKSDNADAVSVGVAAMTATGLRTAEIDQALTALRAVVEHREDLVKSHTQTVNRLHGVLTSLVPGGAPTSLTADKAAELLRGVRPRSLSGRTLRRVAVELIAEVRHLDRRIITATGELTAALKTTGSTPSPSSPASGRHGREDRRPGRAGHPVPLRSSVRVLHRHRPARSLLR